MCIQINEIVHRSFLFAVFRRQTGHHLSEDALVAPPFPAVIQLLMRTIPCWDIAPAQSIAIDKDFDNEKTTFIDARLA